MSKREGNKSNTKKEYSYEEEFYPEGEDLRIRDGVIRHYPEEGAKIVLDIFRKKEAEKGGSDE